VTLATIATKVVATDTISLVEYNNIATDINELIGRSGQNLLTNGGFEVWQRGAGGFTTSVYTADRWFASVIAGTVTKETTTVDGSVAALKVAATGACRVEQKLEDFTQLRGKTLSFSVRVRQGVANNVRIGLSEDGASYTYSATSATTGSFVTLTVTKAISAGAAAIWAAIEVAATDTAYADNAMLVIGPNPTDYVPLHPQEDLARCQRYYEVHGGVNPAMNILAYDAAGAVSGNMIMFHTQKAGTPTMTKNGTWAVTNCGQPGASVPNVNGYVLFATVTALGHYTFNANSTDDSITAEFNP